MRGFGAMAALVLLAACEPPPLCHHVTSDIRIQVIASDVLVMDANLSLEGEVVPWWDKCDSMLDLDGTADGEDVRVLVGFPPCEK